MNKQLIARPDLFAQLAASDPFARSQRRLFERGQVTAVEGRQVTVRVGYGDGDAPLLLQEVPVLSGYSPKVGDWVKIDYEGGHANAPWIVGPSMAEDEEADAGGVSVWTQRASAPPSPAAGEAYYDQTAGTWKGYDGSQWVPLGNRVLGWAYDELDSSPATTSTTWVAVDAANFKVSLAKQTAPSDLLVAINAYAWTQSAAGNQNIVCVDVDGTLYTGYMQSVIQNFPAANQNHHPVLLTRITSLAAGTRVVTPYWRVTAGTGTFGRPRMWVLEMI